jgi:hypothetical protein
VQTYPVQALLLLGLLVVLLFLVVVVLCSKYNKIV